MLVKELATTLLCSKDNYHYQVTTIMMNPLRASQRLAIATAHLATGLRRSASAFALFQRGLLQDSSGGNNHSGPIATFCGDSVIVPK